MAGRKPKPSALKKLAGNPGKRKINAQEPKFDGVAECPPHLSAEARCEWRRVSSELEANGLLTSVDRAALAVYCASWARWVEAEERLAEEGMVLVAAKSGYAMPSPYIAISNSALDAVRKFASEFGMTPSSRSRIHVESPTAPVDPFDEFMSGLNAGTETDGRKKLRPKSN